MHRTLARQLRKLGLTAQDLPGLDAWTHFVTQVSGVYQSNDDDRHLIDRAMQTSSHEMRELMRKLEERNALLTGEIERHAATARKLQFAATHDTLTGLPSRSAMLEELGRCMKRAELGDAQFAVLFIDLDDFKVINDSLGHSVGDEVLKHFTARLCGVCDRAPELVPMVCRLGGDEFVVLLRDVQSREQVLRLTATVRDELAGPTTIAGQRLTISASVGILMGTTTYREPGELLRDADTAMYRAKHGGKGRHVIFDMKMHEESLRRLRTEQELRAAMEGGQVLVVYQPLIELESGRPVGFESLLRWQHPQRGLLSPDAFLEVADESGLMVPIGRAALRTVCRDVASWRGAGVGIEGMRVAVNFSRRQVREPTFVDDLRDACGQNGVEPRQLTVELTENVFVADADCLRERCEQVRALGCGLHMDDFGTGLSSLSCLHEMPFDGVKIDRSFVSRITNRREHTAIVGSIIMLAHNLGLHVVAEGVENVGQLAQLQACDCDIGQGYLFARPMRAEEVVPWLGEHAAPCAGRRAA
ncbi:MAG: EAL domain-containing protein [Phycisphaerales bacterium]